MKNSKSRKIFVTTALPYANGPLHAGHIMEYIQADVWVRFMKMNGHEVFFVCADDTHGAPIMIAAEKNNETPQKFVSRIIRGRKKYLDGFFIDFDNWHSTDEKENHELSKKIYKRLRDDAKLIISKKIEQFFDPQKKMFLSDRYVMGQCPKCNKSDQFGDACEECGAVYSPTDLKNPYSALTGVKPLLKSSEHFFFQLSNPKCKLFLENWLLNSSRLQPEVKNKAREWLMTKEGLNDWDISRDAPYFGIEIPDAPGKYFYVWLDAPIGYLASLKNLFDKSGFDFWSYISDPNTEQYHFIGKDIIYFHTLFWPTILHFAKMKVPNDIFVHGFLTFSGEKMSKSRGTGISPIKYLEIGMDPEWLRYYISAKLNSSVEDVDFNPTDFQLRVNSDLIGKYLNIASRASNFIIKKFDGKIKPSNDYQSITLLANILKLEKEIAFFYETRDYGKAIRKVMSIADEINVFVDQNKPWELAKDSKKLNNLHEVCSTLIETFRILTIFLKPIIPNVAKKVESFLNISQTNWSDVYNHLPLMHEIKPYKHLMKRINSDMLNELFKKDNEKKDDNNVDYDLSEKIGDEINIDEFNKIDLRVGLIVDCNYVEGSNKLLQLKLDIGTGQIKNIFSGIKSAYKPEDLKGKLTVVVANLKPRKMKFGVSEGMVLAASTFNSKSKEDIYVLEFSDKVKPGMKIK